jgi:endogenous inhibitor of DNA gyrase (YacG/DUF329 family)
VPEVNCPTCGARVRWVFDNPFRPFCSERCRLIDLGEWAVGGYAIPGEPAEEEPPPPPKLEIKWPREKK